MKTTWLLRVFVVVCEVIVCLSCSNDYDELVDEKVKEYFPYGFPNLTELLDAGYKGLEIEIPEIDTLYNSFDDSTYIGEHGIVVQPIACDISSNGLEAYYKMLGDTYKDDLGIVKKRELLDTMIIDGNFTDFTYHSINDSVNMADLYSSKTIIQFGLTWLWTILSDEKLIDYDLSIDSVIMSGDSMFVYGQRDGFDENSVLIPNEFAVGIDNPEYPVKIYGRYEIEENEHKLKFTYKVGRGYQSGYDFKIVYFCNGKNGLYLPDQIWIDQYSSEEKRVPVPMLTMYLNYIKSLPEG